MIEDHVEEIAASLQDNYTGLNTLTASIIKLSWRLGTSPEKLIVSSLAYEASELVLEAMAKIRQAQSLMTKLS